MALGKRAYAMHQNGWQYTNENIERLLMERHVAKKTRRASGKHHLKGPRKRSEEDNLQFKDKLERLLTNLLQQSTYQAGGKDGKGNYEGLAVPGSEG